MNCWVQSESGEVSTWWE